MKTLLTAALLVGLAGTPPTTAQEFKISIAEAGIYRVTHADLKAAGLAGEPVASGDLALRSRGRAVPMWVADGGDGTFDPSDHVEFVAERLPGEVSYYHDYTNHNVYWLQIGASRSSAPTTPTAPEACEATPLMAHRHLERDVVRARFPGGGDTPQEAWYWTRLTYLDEPWKLSVELPDLDKGAGKPIQMKVGIRGWSSLGRKYGDVLDHRLEVLLNGVGVAEDEWENERADRVIELRLPPALMREGANELAVRVPRRDDADGAGLVDMVLLNWIELVYPRSSSRFSGQDLVAWTDDRECVEVSAPPGRRLTAWAADGSWRTAGDGPALRFPGSGNSAWIVPADDLRRPVQVVADRPSDLRATSRQADYLMIAHHRLIEAIRPLAEFHRRNGLAVEIVDVEDVFDEFGDGLEIPHAIQSFLEHAHTRWRRPAPRFVLLVGDASWDTKNAEVDDSNYADWTYRDGFRRGEAAEFRKNESTPYARNAELNHRNLVPTWQEITAQGHTASDNAFVVFDGGDRPMMAIGRFPVTEPEEVAAIVDKSIAYATRAPVGPWRTNALFITNESKRYQQRSDGFAEQVSTAGWTSTKVYPESTETSNELHTQHLIEALDAGQHIVHFLGHGGRYIWRTGPPDFRKNHDLFTLDDLERLAPNDKASIILSMSCYSAPFDHPNADSIGEKFLRLGDRGAVAVIAASWRNVPGSDYSRSLLTHLDQADTIGEAFLASKQEIDSYVYRDQYNLLGDPALPVLRPSFELELEPANDDTGTVIARVPRLGFTGRAVVEWFGVLGEPVETRLLTVSDGPLEIAAPDLAPGVAVRVRVYAWNEAERLDGLGVLELGVEESAVDAATANRTPTDPTDLGGTPR